MDAETAAILSPHPELFHVLFRDRVFRKVATDAISKTTSHVIDRACWPYFIHRGMQYLVQGTEHRAFLTDIDSPTHLAKPLYSHLQKYLPLLSPVSSADVEEHLLNCTVHVTWPEAVNAFFSDTANPGASQESDDFENQRRLIVNRIAELSKVSHAFFSGQMLRAAHTEHDDIQPLDWDYVSGGHSVPIPRLLCAEQVLFETESISLYVFAPDDSTERPQCATELWRVLGQVYDEPGSQEKKSIVFSRLLLDELLTSRPPLIHLRSFCSPRAFAVIKSRCVSVAQSVLSSFVLTNQLHPPALRRPVFDLNFSGSKRSFMLKLRKSCDEMQAWHVGLVGDWRELCTLALSRSKQKDSLSSRLHVAVNQLVIADERSVSLEARLVASVTAVEAIVNVGKESLADHLAQCAAVLLEDQGKRRPARVKRIKRLYNIRSRITHGENVSASADDVIEMRQIAAAIILSALDRLKTARRFGGEEPKGSEFGAELKDASLAGRSVDGLDPRRSLAESIWGDAEE